MLENWCWDPLQLKSLSHHYSYLSPEYANAWKENQTEASSVSTEKPAEKMPDELIESITKTKHVNDALFNLRQLHFGTFDMTVHEPASHEEIVSLKISELYNSLRKQIAQLDGPEVQGAKDDWGHGQATFGHLIGGYDAGYYGYLRYDRPKPKLPVTSADDTYKPTFHFLARRSTRQICSTRSSGKTP
jgi:metallopeptidase MepB